MATKRKPRQWMIDDPNVPASGGPQDLLVRLPSGDKVVCQVFSGRRSMLPARNAAYLSI